MDLKAKAKKAMLQTLKKKMREMGGKHAFGEGLGVTVKAKDKEGLKKGLDKASELVDSPKMDKMMEKSEEGLEERLESPMEEGEIPCEHMSEEELEEKIAMMQSVLDEKRNS